MKKATQAETLVTNSLVTGIQIGLSAVISLLTTRMMLKDLGFVDYGLLTALGASGFYSAILMSGLNIAALRHMAFEIGLPEKGRLNETYTATLAVFGGLGIFMVCLGMSLKDTILGAMTIPEERLPAANWVYIFVVAGIGLTSMTAPFFALRQAHQHMVAISLYQLLRQVLMLTLLLAIPFFDWDPLIVVAAGTFIISAIITITLVSHCWHSYPTVRPKPRLLKLSEVWRILKFAKWSMLSMLAMQMRSQFALFVLNIQFGPVVNAAYALANGANGFITRLNGSVYRSLQPAITSAYAKGDKRNIRRMMSIGSRYTTYFVLPIFIPMMLEMETVLKVWVSEYPPQTPLFSRLVITATCISFIVTGYGLAVNAMNRLVENTLIFAPLQFGAFGICTLGIFYFDFPAWTLPVSAIIAIGIQVFVYAYYFGKVTTFTFSDWFVDCLVPILLISGIGFLCASIPVLIFEPSFLRLILTTTLSLISLVAAILAWGIKPDERRLALDFFIQKWQRIRRAKFVS